MGCQGLLYHCMISGLDPSTGSFLSASSWTIERLPIDTLRSLLSIDWLPLDCLIWLLLDLHNQTEGSTRGFYILWSALLRNNDALLFIILYFTFAKVCRDKYREREIWEEAGGRIEWSFLCPDMAENTQKQSTSSKSNALRPMEEEIHSPTEGSPQMGKRFCDIAT